MIRHRDKLAAGEPVTLYRAKSVVNSLLGSFGQNLKETRLTSFLGYLVALRPEAFRDLLGFEGTILGIELETSEDGGRTDIVINTMQGRCVIEAKLGGVDSREQIHGYEGRWRIILSSLPDQAIRCKGRRIRYVSWQTLADTLLALGRRYGQPLKALSNELVRYLEEHRMIRHASVEIYAREINNENTLTLFLHARLYTCLFERGSQLPKAMYFAPHFGGRIANEHPGICQGVSYIARIETVEVVDSWEKLKLELVRLRGRRWFEQHSKLLEGWSPKDKSSLKQEWRKDKQERSILLLGEPRLVFNPPIKKESLQKGKGWLSRRVFSFDEFFEAWSK